MYPYCVFPSCVFTFPLSTKTKTDDQCMEKGLKNLQASDKALRRKERGMGEHDSGFSDCSDAESDADMDPPAEPIQRELTVPEASARAGRSRNMSIQSMLSPSPPVEKYRFQQQ